MGIRICLGCLREVTDETSVCPLCSFSLNDPVNENALKPKTTLNNRYVVGKALQIDGEGISYIGFDAEYKDAVVIREFFPSSISFRQDKSIHVKDGQIATFKSLKSEFIDLHKNLGYLNSISSIAKTRQIFEENSTVYSVCDYIRGITFEEYLRQNAGELDWYQIKNMFRPLLDDINQINKSGYIHRGISIKTIIIDESNHLRLIDFKTCSVRVLGTEIEANVEDGFAAPEQYKVLPNGEWTDVYGICAVLYRVLTGTKPPVAHSRDVNDNLIEPIRLNDTIPLNVSNAIIDGLMYDPRERIYDVLELKNRLYSDNVENTNILNNTNSPLFDPYEEVEEETTKKKGFINSLFDETEEVYEVNEKDNRKKDKTKNEKSTPLVVKVLLWSIPVILIIALVLYQLLVGFSFLNKEDKGESSSQSSTSSSDSSKDESSDESSEENSDENSQESSQEPSSQAPQEPEGIPLENFVGMKYDAITAYTGKFSFAEPSYVFDDKYAEGQICAQSVAPGTLVTPDQIIVLSVSKGPRFLIMPIAENKTAEQFRDYLKEFYKLDSTIIDEYNNTVKAGQVIDTFPKAGTQIDRSSNTVVKIYRSKGPLQATQ